MRYETDCLFTKQLKIIALNFLFIMLSFLPVYASLNINQICVSSILFGRAPRGSGFSLQVLAPGRRTRGCGLSTEIPHAPLHLIKKTLIISLIFQL